MRGGVFVCHASKDAGVAHRIVAALEAGGVSCWIAPRDIEAGQNYALAILEGLSAAPAVVVLFSAATNQSPHVMRELETAASAGTPIVPVRLEDVDPTGALRYFIGAAHWLDAVGTAAEIWEPPLVRAVSRTIKDSAQGQPPIAAVQPTRLIPTGTVTLVFTDIEGSTALLSRLGDAYANAIDGMRAMLRDAWAEFGGVELGTEGDGFYVVFASAPDAVAALVSAQRALGAVDWPSGESLTVRMGAHTGSPKVHGDAYIGMDVHRAVRISAAAHGGQIVVSAAVKALVEDDLPPATRLDDLGGHQLKDIALPERLFQVSGEGLRSDFPPLRSIGTSTSLPTTDSVLIGRDGEMAELEALMRGDHVRLLTLTGAGGSGKTRLSIGLAARLAAAPTPFGDGVHFVPLAEVTAAHGAWPKVGDVLEIPAGSRARPQVLEHLAGRQSLLVLDNMEQIADAEIFVDDLLQGAPKVTVVASSRNPLHVRGEHEHPVPPLGLPAGADPDAIAGSAAVQMFMEYAQRVRPSLTLDQDSAADVALICERLDGLPLALELAAARCKMLSPKALVNRLGTALDIASPGTTRPTRHRSLRETIDWSYRLLSEDLQQLFRELSVFAGGADLEAIAGVVAVHAGTDTLDLVGELVDASLVTITDTSTGEPRVAMLETIRAFARDQLAEFGEIDRIRLAHARYFADLVERVARRWLTNDFAAAHLEFDLEIDNLRDALEYTTNPAGTTAELALVGVRLAHATNRFWSDVDEAHAWLAAAVGNPSAAGSPDLAIAMASLARTTLRTNDVVRARAEAEDAAAVARHLDADDALCSALGVWAQCEIESGELEHARALVHEGIAVAQRSGNLVRLANLHDTLGFVSDELGDLDGSLAFHQKALDTATSIDYGFGIESFSQNVACALSELGRHDEAGRRLRAIIRAGVSSGDVESMMTLAEDYASVLVEQARHGEAATLFGASAAARELFHEPATSQQATDMVEPIARARAALTPEVWESTYGQGRLTRLDLALLEHAEAT